MLTRKTSPKGGHTGSWQFSLRTLLIFVAICAVAIVVSARIYFAISLYVGTTRLAVSSSAANQALSAQLHLPRSASDVSYYVDFGAEEAEFAISESDFLKWCRLNGWKIASITTPQPYFEPMAMPNDSHLVDRGYLYWPPEGRGVFDADNSRACFWTSTFP